jgi:hypothetical protein
MSDCFSNILTEFNDYDLDHDGISEIQSLTLLEFEDKSEAVRPNQKFVIILVEPRLLKPLSHSTYAPEHLLQRLSVLKSDLLKEGIQSRFLLAQLYEGPVRQEGKTLLAVREFFKAVRGSYSNFDGAILIGSFPDARITWLWPQHGTKTHAGHDYETYFTGGFLRAQPRYDIVLADLVGSWRDIYCQRVTLNAYWFCKNENTVVHEAPDQSKITLNNPLVIINDASSDPPFGPLEVYDTFFIQDNTFSIRDSVVEFSLVAANPEVSATNKRLPNPIATPTIIVSRINARSVAVQPPARALDGNGKPKETTAAVGLDDWSRDKDLERTLLVRYFDRNHAFRSGQFATLPFKVSLLEAAGYGTTSADQGIDGMGCAVDQTSNARLLEFIRWLKAPAPFRAISSHADCHFTELTPDTLEEAEVNARAAENEAGGHPWRWQEREGKWIPSFSGYTVAELPLYRTLWENGKFTSVCPSLMLHVGCDVNLPENGEQAYNSNGYGRFQNAESLLFYGNQLAIISHVCHWNQGPTGFGNGFGESPLATFGDGWREFSNTWSQDSSLQTLDKQCDRKRNYEWGIVGDWTLRKWGGFDQSYLLPILLD